MTRIPYSLLCATTMNMDVTEITLVILVGIWVLLFSVRFIIRNFSLKSYILRFIHFCYCVIIFHKKAFLVGVLLISLSGYLPYVRRFPCGICKKSVNRNAVCCDICNKRVHIYCSNITRYCYRKLQKNETPWYCKICTRWAMPFCNLADHQLEVLMLGKLITFPKLILSNN